MDSLNEIIDQGSSPRGRGKRGCRIGVLRVRRLIPARAGKTTSTRRLSAGRAAHPRAGGENQNEGWNVERKPGSSPRRRGKPPVRWGLWAVSRLIPAQAGKTLKLAQTPFLTPAHPRAGGENLAHALPDQPASGSSPCRRGKL